MGISSFYTTLSSASSAGAGISADFGEALTNVSMLVRLNDGVTGGVVSLEVSHDGVNFIKFANTGSLNSNIQTAVSVCASAEAWRFARGVIDDAITGGGSVTCTIMAAGK